MIINQLKWNSYGNPEEKKKGVGERGPIKDQVTPHRWFKFQERIPTVEGGTGGWRKQGSSKNCQQLPKTKMLSAWQPLQPKSWGVFPYPQEWRRQFSLKRPRQPLGASMQAQGSSCARPKLTPANHVNKTKTPKRVIMGGFHPWKKPVTHKGGAAKVNIQGFYVDRRYAQGS